MAARTSNSVDGKVEWWYHAALIVRLNDGKLYILDPALDSNPIEKVTWYKLSTNGVKDAGLYGFVTCEHNTYAPSYDCFNPKLDFDKGCINFQLQILLI